VEFEHDNLGSLYRKQVREHRDSAMFIMDPCGTIKTWNQGVQDIFGYSESEWTGRQANLIFTEEDRAAGVYESEMQMAAEQGRSKDIRWHRRKDGSRIYMVGVLQALRGDSGELVGFSKVCMDDTARKNLEDALTRSNQDLLQFAHLASHDMQEPLRTINSFLKLFVRRFGENLDEEAQEYLRLINDAAERMNLLIHDLLAFSQIGLAEDMADSVHLDEDLETAVAMLRSSIDATGAVVTHDALPDVKAVRGQMVRLFQNLIGNAVKFRKPDVTPKVHVCAEREGNEWVISVRDNGIGFPPQHAETIFVPFKRLHGQTEYPGTGIGLAACKRIVERHGGRIGAESQTGEGATFWFTIPVDPSR
jgi:PAS domain S-box-containing protein